jgi:hypothetical protein
VANSVAYEKDPSPLCHVMTVSPRETSVLGSSPPLAPHPLLPPFLQTSPFIISCIWPASKIVTSPSTLLYLLGYEPHAAYPASQHSVTGMTWHGMASYGIGMGCTHTSHRNALMIQPKRMERITKSIFAGSKKAWVAADPNRGTTAVGGLASKGCVNFYHHKTILTASAVCRASILRLAALKQQALAHPP